MQSRKCATVEYLAKMPSNVKIQMIQMSKCATIESVKMCQCAKDLLQAVENKLFSPCLSGSPRQRKCHPKQSLFTMKKHLRFDLSFFLPLIHTFLDEACKHQLLGAFEFDILRNSEVGFWELDKRLFIFIFVIFLVLLS